MILIYLHTELIFFAIFHIEFSNFVQRYVYTNLRFYGVSNSTEITYFYILNTNLIVIKTKEMRYLYHYLYFVFVVLEMNDT